MSKGIPSPHTFAAYCRNFSLDFSAGYAIMVSLKSFHIKIIEIRRYSSSVERQLPKLERRVRFPLSA